MTSRAKELQQLIAEHRYHVDERAVADAIMARARVRAAARAAAFSAAKERRSVDSLDKRVGNRNAEILGLAQLA